MTLTYNESTPGHIRMTIFSTNPDSIPAGIAPIVQIKFSIYDQVPPQASPLTLRDVYLSSPQGQILDVVAIDGVFVILGCNLLRVKNGYGTTGSSGNRIQVSLINPDPLSGFQFILNFNPSVLSLDTLLASYRTEGMDLYYHQTNPGTLQVLAFDPLGDLIPADTGSIAQIMFTVFQNPTAEISTLELKNTVLTDSSGQIVENVSVNGTFLVEDFVRTPDINLPTTEHYFGNVKVGSSGSWTLSIINQGQASLTISEISTDNQTFTIDSTFPQMISPGGVLDFLVNFAPTEEGDTSGTLSITSNDPDEGQLSIFLSGRGTVPRIKVVPASMDFGDVPAGNDSSSILFILNTGWPHLEVYDVNHSEPAFTISDTAGTVAGGDSAEITVAFTPTEKIPYRDSLIILNNDRRIAVPLQGNGVSSVKESGKANMPQTHSLSQNYPNPFNPTTQIEYTLPCHSHVTLEVYNILGEKVATLVDEKQETGYKRARWDAGSFSSGSYFYRLRTGEYEMTRRMVLLR